MKKDGKSASKAGFTIVELLTVMAVIGVLIGLLVPALNLVRDYAKEIQQKGQFHSIGVGLEMFKTEFGFYPPSDDNVDPAHIKKVVGVDEVTAYGGAQKLAEAMVGWDLLGFHPRSDFRSDGTFSHDDGSGTGTMVPRAPAYHPDVPYTPTNTLFEETALENVQARKGPFIELENANAYTMEDVYGNQIAFGTDALGGALPSPFWPLNFVLCDEFAKKRELGKKTGMPILYFRAHTNRIEQNSDATDNDFSDNNGVGDSDVNGYYYDEDIFEYGDNDLMVRLGAATQPAEVHPVDISPSVGIPSQAFDNMILNPQVTTIARPFRAGSYILISAGKDGLYGNADDIYNFDKE